MVVSNQDYQAIPTVVLLEPVIAAPMNYANGSRPVPTSSDPAEYLASIISSSDASTECKVAASGNLMPYLYSKLGAITPQRFVETLIHVPDFHSIDDVEQFLNHVARHVARGSLSIDHGKELADLARAWVHTHYADDELRIKIAASMANDPNHPLTIRIAGGLPPLPGSDVIMPQPDQLNGKHLELPGTAINAPQSRPANSGEPANEESKP
jgi:hypothetical protein